MRRPLRAVILSLLLGLSTGLIAQQHPNVARGFDIGRSYQMNGIDNVNLFNGSLTATIPIGQRYHVNGNLQYGLTLVYNSNVWETVQADHAGENSTTYPNRRSNAGIGWLLSLGRLFPNNQFPLQESPDWNYESPDGGLHQFLGSGDTNGVPPFYTSDGSYLRLLVNASGRTVEFPDGTQQVFQDLDNSMSPWAAQGTNGRWRLTKIKDRFGNVVTIQYSSTSDYPEIWAINDGIRTQSVYFVTAPDDSTALHHHNFYTLMLDHVVLATFGAPSETSRTWTMRYDTQFIRTGNPVHGNFNDYAVPLLTGVTLPLVGTVSQTYSMQRPDGTAFYNISLVSSLANGGLRGMQLPTKGWIEWDYAVQTFSHGSEEGISRSLAVATRRTLTPDRAEANTSTWTYRRQESDHLTCVDSNFALKDFGPEQLVVSVTSPELVTSVHYFSIFTDPGAIPCVPTTGLSTFDFNSYALPFTSGVSASLGGEQQHLSEETYLGTPSLATSPTQYRVSGGSRQRSEWALYRGDVFIGDHTDELHKPESAHASMYDDDAHCGDHADEICFASVTRYGHDRAGHYRQSSTSGNFASGNFTTSFTNYTGVSDSDTAWLLNRFTEQCTVEDSSFRGAMPASPSCSNLATAPATGSILSGPFIKQYCFDGTTGFPTRQRTLTGTTPGPHDLLAAFIPQNGNVTQEDYFGGDAQTLGLDTVCTVTVPPSSEYQILHTYSNGSLEKSYHRPKSGDPIIYEANNVIDASTGLVSTSTDVSGLVTSYNYDALGRLTGVTRPGEAAVTATYTEATSTSGAKVAVEQASADAGTMRSTTIFDGFGRVSEEQQLMPAGTAKRQTQYNGSGWVTAVSEWEATPTHFTVFSDFDAFGRAHTITPPSQQPTTVEYFGVRKVNRSVSVGETLSGTTVQPATATTTETYDRAGRLIEVDDPDGISKAIYGYDAGGRLRTVNMTDLSAGTSQPRTFSYDGRGFLTSEQHPENGTTLYQSYDSRGHAGRKLAGSSYTVFDLKYEYDALERLVNVYQLPNRAADPVADVATPVKQFRFASANDGTNIKKGKLETATRQNYSTLGTIDVKETYEYSDNAGRLTKKTTEVTGPTGTLQKYSQGYTYNDAGLFSEIKYPTCPDGNCATGSSMISSVFPTYQNGLLKTVPGFTTNVTYGLNGMVTQIDHPGPVNDVITADANGLSRPAKIQFNSYDACVSPQISLPGNKQVSPGSSPGLQVTVLNTPTAPLTYQWLKDGSVLAGETSSSCCTTPASSATYTARLINSCGKGEASTVVAVCGSPTVSVTPQNSTYANNTPVTLTASASGCGLTYQWYIGDSGITSSPTGTNSSSLTVSPASTTHYWVRVTDNTNATANSNTAIVTACSTPSVSVTPQNSTYASTPVTLTASATGCSLTYQWYIGDSGITTSPTGTNSSSLTVSPTSTTHYWVRVTDNTNATANSNTAIVTVGAALPTPGALRATFNAGVNTVGIIWGTSAGADHYELQRLDHGVWTTLSVSGTFTTYTPTAGTAYVFRVRAVDSAGGNVSPYTANDLATAMSFATLQANATVVNFDHFEQIRTAINAIRAAQNSPALTWRQILDAAGFPNIPVPGHNAGIYAAHILALRSAMTAALSAVQITDSAYTDSLTSPTPIKALHITQLQYWAE